MKKIKKRNGSLEEFNGEKIKKAIEKSNYKLRELTKEDIDSVYIDVLNSIENNMDVESIQDLVVYSLMKHGFYKTSYEYTKYREIRTYQRNVSLQKIFDSMGDIVEFGDNENSNKNYGLPSVIRDTIAGEYFKANLKNVLNPIVYQAFVDRFIHWHDRDVDPKLTNCCVFNIIDMLENGTRINNADIEEPNSVGVAMNIGTQIMASISSQQYGKIIAVVKSC